MSEVRICRACQRVQAYAQPICRGCGGSGFDACVLPLEATVFSLTTVSRAPTPALAALTPYTAVLVEASKGGLLLVPFRGAVPPAIGDAVTVDMREDALVALPA